MYRHRLVSVGENSMAVESDMQKSMLYLDLWTLNQIV